jgi:hypothetical protein
MDHITQNKTSAILISQDAEKAFDSVGLDNLFQIMEKNWFQQRSDTVHKITVFMSEC